MFKKILIANRGEIACRVIKTARKMGIKTVAVYSEADARALHASLADEAICIGPPPARESYLVIDNIIKACKESGAEAVHPGYGFLSENAGFAERLDADGIVFIGPPAKAIESMGDKVTAKRLAIDAGVNTIPGPTDVIHTAEQVTETAAAIGYPVMLKAAAGGGGKGMRIANNDEECRSGFDRAASEAQSAFGDGRVFIEKFFAKARHIEIQVLADRHGNVVHLGERECSLQRRHQKIIEESPSPFIDERTREEMGEQAGALARAVNYESAGTVEFIVDAGGDFYFLEMNTRLQVEHPVTEFVTGLDLVELMIRIAAGEPLPMAQGDIVFQGAAIEARVYAEDPARNFLPSVGRLIRYLPPEESPHVRVDAGVYEGDEISIHYDPMIAKVITHAKTRDEAISQMLGALDNFYIQGVSHNISFLAALVQHDQFEQGAFDTNLVAELYSNGFDPRNSQQNNPALLVTVAASIHCYRTMRLVGDWVVVIDDQQHPVRVRHYEDQQSHEVQIGDSRFEVVSDWYPGQPLFKGTINGEGVCVQVEQRETKYILSHRGSRSEAVVLTHRAAELLSRIPAKEPTSTYTHLLSPMPGLLSQLLVDDGDRVKAGQDLAIVEAMKMENVLRAERDCTVAKQLANVGDTLAVDQPILEFE